MRYSYPKLHSIKWKGRFDSLHDNLDADNVLESAKGIKSVVLVGVDREGALYIASSLKSDADSVYLLSKAHNVILNMKS
jgi:hypothetical protein